MIGLFNLIVTDQLNAMQLLLYPAASQINQQLMHLGVLQACLSFIFIKVSMNKHM